jgi:photosystem II stability/assembly factor-like uncharacterized protein
MKSRISLLTLFFLIAASLQAQNFWENVAQFTVGQFSGKTAFVTKDNLLFAGNLAGLYRSSNNGDNWTQLTLNHSVLSLTKNSQGILFAGTLDNGIYYSTNDGNTWMVRGVNTGSFGPMAVNSNDHIFAGSPGVGMFRSTNNGLNWTQINSGLTNNNVNSISINSNGVIFLGTQNRVHRSTNNGDSWILLSPSPVNATLDISSSNEVYAGANDLLDISLGGHIYKSTDNGNSWIPIPIVTSCYSYAVAVSPSGDLYAGAIGPCTYVFRSTNGGGSWNDIVSGLFNNSLSIVSFAFSSAGYVFGGQQNDGYIYRSGQAYIGIKNIGNEIPNLFSLSQNYPNPFNPNSKIKFQISKSSDVKLLVFDVLGREVAALVNQPLQPGTYEVEFDGTDYPSGVYYYRLISELYTETKKMILIK